MWWRKSDWQSELAELAGVVLEAFAAEILVAHAPLLNPARAPQEYEARQRQLVGQVLGTEAREESVVVRADLLHRMCELRRSDLHRSSQAERCKEDDDEQQRELKPRQAHVAQGGIPSIAVTNEHSQNKPSKAQWHQ
jgi:hypothetical protein